MSVPTWQDVFRRGLAPLLSEVQLRALETALETDDPRLIQCITCEPYPFMPGSSAESPVTRACVIGLCAWEARKAAGAALSGVGARVTVAEIERDFSDLVHAIDQRLGVLSSQALVDWIDTTPRVRMRARLRSAVRAALAERSDAGV